MALFQSPHLLHWRWRGTSHFYSGFGSLAMFEPDCPHCTATAVRAQPLDELKSRERAAPHPYFIQVLARWQSSSLIVLTAHLQRFGPSLPMSSRTDSLQEEGRLVDGNRDQVVQLLSPARGRCLTLNPAIPPLQVLRSQLSSHP